MESPSQFGPTNPHIQQIAVIASVVALVLALVAAVGYIYFHSEIPGGARTLLSKASLVDAKGDPVEPFCFSVFVSGVHLDTKNCLPDWTKRVGPITRAGDSTSGTYQDNGLGSNDTYSYSVLGVVDNVMYVQVISTMGNVSRIRVLAMTSDWEPGVYKILWSHTGDYGEHGVTAVIVGDKTVTVKQALGNPYFFHNRTDKTNAIEGIYVNGELVVGILNAKYDTTWRSDQEIDPDYECVVAQFNEYRTQSKLILTPTELTDLGTTIVAACGLEEYGVGL